MPLILCKFHTRNIHNTSVNLKIEFLKLNLLIVIILLYIQQHKIIKRIIKNETTLYFFKYNYVSYELYNSPRESTLERDCKVLSSMRNSTWNIFLANEISLWMTSTIKKILSLHFYKINFLFLFWIKFCKIIPIS